MNDIDIDFTCEVNKCDRVICLSARGSRDSRFCNNHRNLYYRYGTATPTVKCFECRNNFTFFPGMTLGAGGNKYACSDCLDLLSKYGHLAKRSCREHGITRTDFIKLLIAQGFSCKICDEEDKKLVIDHDHTCCSGVKSCGKCIRGLICHRCNTVVGQIEYNAGLLPKCYEYLGVLYGD